MAEFLDDDEAKPKPKPSTAAPEIAQALDVTPNEPSDDAEEDEEEEVLEAVKPVITIQKVPEAKPQKPTKAPKKPKATTAAPTKAELPPLNLQNTSALLELQAQLTANNVKNGELSDEAAPQPKPTKTQKKKKTSQKGQAKKQAAIITNEISETPAEKTLTTDTKKPQEIVEESVVMEKVPLKTPESEKLKQKQQEVEYFDDDEESEKEVISVKS